MKYNHTVSIRELSQRSGVDEKTIHARITALKITKKRVRKRGFCSVTMVRKCDVERILSADRFILKNSPRKIQIIEMHIEGISARKICEIMSICKKTTLDIIKYYKETECVIVESKLNRML